VLLSRNVLAFLVNVREMKQHLYQEVNGKQPRSGDCLYLDTLLSHRKEQRMNSPGAWAGSEPGTPARLLPSFSRCLQAILCAELGGKQPPFFSKCDCCKAVEQER